MKSILELNKSKVPAVRIDPEMDKYDKVVLFPEKLELANKMLENSNFIEVIERNFVVKK